MLPCEAGTANFFIEPNGDVYPCNGLEDKYWKEKIGNIREAKSFEEIWRGEQACKVREMVGTAAPVMKKYIRHPLKWVLENKIKTILGKEICLDKIPKYNV